MRIGAHVPTRGRLARAVDAALQTGCQAFQIFVSNPRGWAPPTVAREAAAEFEERRRAARLGPVYAHASYLVNVASPDPASRSRSVDLARRELAAVETIGADGLVVHAGAGGRGERPRAVARAAASVLEILDGAERPPVILELTAGGSGTVASSLPEAAELIDAIGSHPRVLLCLDTCHLFAAGYPLDDPTGVRETFETLATLGLEVRVRVVHGNDARAPRGSRLDRHTHVGEGHIGEQGFRAILAEPVVGRCAVLVETPGRLEDHARNVAALRRLSAGRSG